MVTDLTKTGGEDGRDVVESLKGGEELVAALVMIMTTTTVMMVMTAMMILMLMEVGSLILKANGPPPPYSILDAYDVPSLTSYRFCVEQCRGWSICLMYQYPLK